jgi:phosphate butyryltransferase
LNDKIQILTNAVGVCQALGNPLPKVAILSAIETINPNLQSTQDAAILTKMNQRGQIPGCIVDGPLALDNALSAEAAAIKGIHSAVAGAADILLCPDIESAISCQILHLFGAMRLAHVLIGRQGAVLIPSRARYSRQQALVKLRSEKSFYHHQIEAVGQSRKCSNPAEKSTHMPCV